MVDFFLKNIVGVYFFYGLSFFSMGLAVLLEVGHSSELDFAQALKPLAGFGLVHGSHEWFEMFLLMDGNLNIASYPTWISITRLVMLGASFIMLVVFGVRLITGPGKTKPKLLLMLIVIGLWLFGLILLLSSQLSGDVKIVAADVYTRYSLAIPGGILAAWGLLLQGRQFLKTGMQRFGRDVAVAALAFAWYGGIGQLFSSPSMIFPSQYLNANVFLDVFGFPIQVFRAMMAAIAAFFIIRSLRAFEVENRRRIIDLTETQLVEQRRLEELRSELLHRTVKAQESERQRIARELHDETGQTMTALGMGLHALADSVDNKPDRAFQQAKHLERLALDGVEELQRIVSGLHPPQLDDLGLMAALRWYAGDITTRFGIQVNVTGEGSSPGLSSEVRIVLFRIAQEAITNAVKHANTDQIDINLNYSKNNVCLKIADYGDGFDVSRILMQRPDGNPSWGLLGMEERANLVGGHLEIISKTGEGTHVEVCVPLED
jgi:signal transduction histidine kinase